MSKVQSSEIKQHVQELLSPYTKAMWAPMVEENIDPLAKKDITQSKYFGSPWLYAKEGWPLIGDTPALFVMQLNIATLPEEMAKKLGGTGLLQFFYQTDHNTSCDWDECALVRVVDITKPGKTLPQPKVVDYLLPSEKLITGWIQYIDYPHPEDLYDKPVYAQIEKFCKKHGLYANDVLDYPYQGDKLGGWPFWTQGTEGVENYIYQIDAGCFFDGLHVPAYAPALFATDGTGHIFIDPDLNYPNFSWACG